MISIKSTIKIVLVILVLLNTFSVLAQQKVFNGNPDKAFKTARELAFNGHRKQAQDSLRLILTKYPNYHDIRAFLASTYSWDGNYKKAQKEFDYVLQKNPNRKSTWIAAIKNQLWAEKPFSALDLANNALKYFPDNSDILLLQARAEANSNNPEDAIKTTEKVLAKDPKNQKAIDYNNTLDHLLSYNKIGIRTSIDFYSKIFHPTKLYTFLYGRQTKMGSIYANININNRFNKTGAQFSVDMYPSFKKGLYGYLNFGFANTSLFPDFRYGAELYKSLPNGFEASLGLRGLKYTRWTTIYTGSFTWYTGNSYWSFRTYITPGGAGTSKSGTLTYRKYRSDTDNYFSVAVGIGYSPDIDRFIFSNNAPRVIKLNSQKINFAYFFTTTHKQNAWGAKFGMAHQEMSFRPGSYYYIYNLGFSWQFKFR